LDVTVAPRDGLRITAQGTWNDAHITDVANDVPQQGTAPALAGAALVVGWRPVTATANHDEPLEPGAPVPGVARYNGRLGLEAMLTASLASRAALRFSGPFTPIGEPNIRTQAYALVDLGATVRLARSGPSLDLDLLNLLDTKYPELRASGFLNPGAPRALRMAVRLGHQT
jgi:hypothetical protein